MTDAKARLEKGLALHRLPERPGAFILKEKGTGLTAEMLANNPRHIHAVAALLEGEGVMTFPGMRGKTPVITFHLDEATFKELVKQHGLKPRKG